MGMNSKEIPVKIENGKVQPLRVVLEEAELNWMKLWLPVCFPVKGRIYRFCGDGKRG